MDNKPAIVLGTQKEQEDIMISEGMYLPLQIGLYDVVEEPWLNVESSDDQRSGWCRLRHTLRPSYKVVHT